MGPEAAAAAEPGILADGTRPVFSDRVVRHLLSRKTITQEQLEEAQRTRGFFGGQLESHLFKLGFIQETALGEALTEASGLPYASGDRLRGIPPEVLAFVPSHIAERNRVCPFQLEERRLRLAMLNPKDTRIIAELQTATGLTVEPWVTSEYRIYQALERYYRIRSGAVRSISLAPPPPSRSAVPATRSSALPSPEPPEPELGLDGRPLDAELDYEALLPSPQEPVPLEESEASLTTLAGTAGAASTEKRSQIGPSAAPSAPQGARGTDAALERLENGLAGAVDREALIGALLEFCAGRASRTGIFAVGRDEFRGSAGRGRAFESVELRRVSIPLGTSTIFDTALGSRNFYFGVVPALPANRDLYTVLGGRLPATVLLIPIRVKERTAALLYMDGDDQPMMRPDIALMLRVAAKAGLAFELLLLRNKLREI